MQILPIDPKARNDAKGCLLFLIPASITGTVMIAFDLSFLLENGIYYKTLYLMLGSFASVGFISLFVFVLICWSCRNQTKEKTYREWHPKVSPRFGTAEWDRVHWN